MKKTLIALALTTLPVAAMAEVVLYGQIKAGYETNSSKVTGWDRDPYLNGIADYGSRFGIKGSEQFGNGLKAIWQVESRIHLGNNTNSRSKDTLANRDSFIGLEHEKYGKVRLGRISNAINADMDVLDKWEYDNKTLGLGKFTRTDARYVGIAYNSPTWAGFDFSLLYAPRDNANGGDRVSEYDLNIGTGEKVSLGLNYKNSNFYVKYGFDFLKHSGDKLYCTYANAGCSIFNADYHEMKDGQVHRLEGGYDDQKWYVGLGYQFAKNVESYSTFANYLSFISTARPGVEDHNVIIDNSGQEAALTVGYHFGNIFPKISYAHGFNVKVNGSKVRNTKYDQIVLGADYTLSKRTTANVQAGWLREGLGEEYIGNGQWESNGKVKTTAFGVGLKHVF